MDAHFETDQSPNTQRTSKFTGIRAMSDAQEDDIFHKVRRGEVRLEQVAADSGLHFNTIRNAFNRAKKRFEEGDGVSSTGSPNY